MAVDPMSDKKKSTGEDLSRNTSKALARKMTSLPDFAARRKAIFSKQIPASQVRFVDKLIAGE